VCVQQSGSGGSVCVQQSRDECRCSTTLNRVELNNKVKGRKTSLAHQFDQYTATRTATHTAAHAATCCNTLQITAAHTTTLPSSRPSAHCTTLHHSALHTAPQCNTVQHSATHRSKLERGASVFTNRNSPPRSSRPSSAKMYMNNIHLYKTNHETSACIATHCNTLLRSATPCNTLQHTLQHAATRCNTHCNTLQHTATHCYAL